MNFDPKIHHRRSIRLKGYDYTRPGAYFITLVTHQRGEIFGELVDGEVVLSALGRIAQDEWMRSIQIRKEIRLFDDEFVVMPNHVHGIVWMVDPTVGADGVRPDTQPSTITAGAKTNQADVLRSNHRVGANIEGACHAPPLTPQPVRVPKSLGSFIAGFKASVTSRAMRELNMTGIWQRNYYEHIIRSEAALNNIWAYIDNNPSKWVEDQLRPSAPPNKFNHV